MTTTPPGDDPVPRDDRDPAGVPAEGGAPPQGPRRLGAGWWAVALGLYLGFRVLVLLGNVDVVAIPTYEVSNMGTLAELLARGGPRAPIWMHFDNAGGQQVTAGLAAPLFALFGSSYLALKLVPLLLGVVVLVMLGLLAVRWHAPRAAPLVLLLFAFAPPTLAKYSLLAQGNHFENLPFQLALYVAALGALTAERRAPWLLATGFAAGFAQYVYPGTVVLALVLALLFVVVRGVRGALADLAYLVPGALVGAVPLLLVNLLNRGRTAGFVGGKLAGSPEDVLARLGGNLVSFFGAILPHGGQFEDAGPVPGAAFEVLLLLVLAACWVVLAPAAARGIGKALAGLRRGEHGRVAERARLAAVRDLPLLLYLPVFAFVIGLGRFDFDPYAHPVEVGQYRYLVPHLTLLTLLVGAAVSRLVARGGGARVAAWGLGGASLITGLGTLPIADLSMPDAGAARRYEGHDFRSYAAILLQGMERDDATGRFVLDRERLRGWLADLPRELSLQTWEGVGYHQASAAIGRALRTGTHERLGGLTLEALVAGAEPHEAVALARGAGSCLRRAAAGDARSREALARTLRALVAVGHPLVGWLAEGLGREYRFTLVRTRDETLAMTTAAQALLPPSLAAAGRRGLGAQVGRLLARGIPADVEALVPFLAAVPPGARADVWWGVGHGLAERGGPGALRGGADRFVPPERRLDALRGAGCALRLLDRGFSAPLDELDEADRAALAEGLAWPGYPRLTP